MADPTLTVADNANGTATATIASGGAGAVNTVYSQKIDPSFATAAWVNSGNRTGNGTVPLTFSNGCYFGQVRTDGGLVSEAIYFGVTDGTKSLYQQILEAVQARILLLDLSGVLDANVVIREWPKLQAEDVPATGTGIILCPTKALSPPGDGTIDRDEVTYPAHLVFVSKASPPLDGTNVNPWALHLERTAKAFRSQRLSGVTGVYTCSVENFDVVNIPHWLNNRWVSGLLLKFKARESRGIT